MINRVTAGEDHRRIIGDIDLLFPEVLRGNTLHNDKWVKINSNSVFPG